MASFSFTNGQLVNIDLRPVMRSLLPGPSVQKTGPEVFGTSNGARVVLCTDQGIKVYIHEILVRRCTNLLDPFESIEEFRDPFGLLVIVLQDVKAQTLQALCHLLYTGECMVASKEDEQALRKIVEFVDIVNPTGGVTDMKTELPDTGTIKSEPNWAADIDDDVFNIEQQLSGTEAQPQDSQDGDKNQIDTNSPPERRQTSDEGEVSRCETGEEDKSNTSGLDIGDTNYVGDTNVESSSDKVIHPKSNRPTHSGDEPSNPPSKQCSKGFRNKNKIKRHELTHTGEKPFQCSLCDKWFTRKQDVKRHKLTHTGEKPFQCSFCDKQFSQKEKAQRHELTHTGEKPFQCSHCDKWFARKGDIKMHERTHTGEKPFQCSHCDKWFTRKQHVKRHELTHTGEKPI